MKNLKIICYFGIVIILILLSLYYNKNQNYQELLSLNSTLSDSIKFTVNKNGEHVARINAYSTQKRRDFLRYQSNDSATKILQKEVNRLKKHISKQGSVTNFSTETKLEITGKTEIIKFPKDSIYPSYKGFFDLDGWVYGYFLTNASETKLSLKVRNDYVVLIGSEKSGLLGFGKRKPFAQVTNKNPYSETISLRSYQVSMPKTKRVGIGPMAGYGIGNGFKNGFFIGIGIQYNLIKF